MLGRALSLVAALLLACASTGAHGYARPLQPESAHQGFATAAQGAQRDQPNVTPEAASENSATPAEASDGRRFYAKARYYGAGRGSFISVDPWDGDIANPVSLNKYLYGYANPGVYIDPDGRCPVDSFRCGLVQSVNMAPNAQARANAEGVLAAYDADAPARAKGTVTGAAIGSAAVPGGLLLRATYTLGRAAYATWTAYGWRAAVMTHGAEATTLGGLHIEVAAGVATNTPSPASMVPALGSAATASPRMLDAQADALRPAVQYSDDAARLTAQSDVPAAPIVRAESQPLHISEGLSGQPVAEPSKSAARLVTWVDEGGNLRAGSNPGMRQDAYAFQSSTPGARSNFVSGRSQAPYLQFVDENGSVVGAKFDGVSGSELIDRKMNPVFSAKAVDQGNL